MSGHAAPQADAPPLAVFHLPRDHQGTTGPPIPAERGERVWNEPLMRQNAVWFCRLRWIVVGVLAAAGLAGFFPEPLQAMGLVITPTLPLATAAVLAILNLVFGRLVHPNGESGQALPVKVVLWAQIISDLLVLTAVIHWLGSGVAAAPFMYLFHIILACIVFSAGESLLVVGLAAGIYLSSLLLELWGLVPRMSVLVGAGTSEDPLLSESSFALGVASMLLIWAVIWYLVSRLAGTLQHREHELALTNVRLEASSEERAKHMLQTTHQLKAPFAAIHAQTQLLLGDYCGTLPAKARAVVEKISARSMALSRQIQEMLQLANLRSRGQTSPPRKRILLDQLIDAALARIEPSARQRGIRLVKHVQSVTVEAVEDHLTMLLDNLIVNAVNYSLDGGEVEVTCQASAAGEVVVQVRDHGIGIPREKLPRIFDDYYRTDEAAHHNRNSTGLGLAIVRQAAQEAGLDVQVETAVGWGTCVTVTLPGPPGAKHSPKPKE